MYGGDAAIPLKGVTLKAEAAYFTSTTKTEDEYALYVVQLERQAGEWFFIGGYAGQVVTEHRSLFDFAPDRGLTSAFLGRAGYTIDTNRSVALETALRQNGQGMWAKLEYSQAFGAHWRATAAFTLIRGDSRTFWASTAAIRTPCWRCGTAFDPPPRTAGPVARRRCESQTYFQQRSARPEPAR